MKKKSELKIWSAVASFTSAILLAVLAIGIVDVSAGSPTYVSGIISSNTTWTAADSPYIVTGSILVKEGVTLTIEPGVMIKFNSGKGIQINGELIARGTEAKPIVFTSNQSSPAPGDWVNILFNDSSVDASYDEAGNYLSGSILQYCTVEYSGGGAAPAIKMISSSPFIDHCIIKNNVYRAISIEEGSLRVYNNIIENNGGSAIYAHAQSVYSPPTVIIHGNTINSNLWSGICTCGVSAVISCNTITNNSGEDGGGIHNCPTIGSKVIISNNTITGNSANRGGGIYNNQYYGEVIIVNNTINNNFANNSGKEKGEGGGIWTSYGWEGKTMISYNEISSNVAGSSTGGGIEIVGGQPIINYNNIYNNTPYDIRNHLSWDAPTIDATNNWWGTTDEDTIKEHIYDWWDDSGLGVVEYIPYLTKPVTPEDKPPITLTYNQY